LSERGWSEGVEGRIEGKQGWPLVIKGDFLKLSRLKAKEPG